MFYISFEVIPFRTLTMERILRQSYLLLCSVSSFLYLTRDICKYKPIPTYILGDVKSKCGKENPKLVKLYPRDSEQFIQDLFSFPSRSHLKQSRGGTLSVDSSQKESKYYKIFMSIDIFVKDVKVQTTPFYLVRNVYGHNIKKSKW